MARRSGPAFRAAPLRVRVPATTANLGPGFDAMGLALALHDDVVVRVTDEPGLAVDVAGMGAASVPRNARNLVVRSMRAKFTQLPGAPAGLEVVCANRVPHGRGLGSSAAAIVAGLVAARALAGASTDPEDVLPLANVLEGHPDNVAPCLFGGLTIAWITTGAAGLPAARAVRLDPHPEVRPVAFIAPEPVSTKVARGLLPASVSHADAAGNAGRAALLIAALTAHPDALLDGTEDKLHQDYRAPVMPHTHDLVTRLRAAGMAAVVSGAGPSVLAFLTENPTEDVLKRLDSIAVETGIDWHISPLVVERQGASVRPGVPSTRRC
jgi:homoserine kinase